VIPRFTDEKSVMKLNFATLIRASERWCHVSINDLERQQLRLLRRELGIDPSPDGTGEEMCRRKDERNSGRDSYRRWRT
jgi:hypothetical protein